MEEIAYDLTAKLVMKDGMSAPLKRITDRVKGADKASQQLRKSVMGVSGGLTAAARSADRTSSSITKMAKATSSAGKAFISLRSSGNSAFGDVVKGAAAVAAAMGAAKLATEGFRSTIGAAVMSDFDKITTTALFRGDTKAANAYFDLLNKTAANNAMLDIGDLMGSSKSFAMMSKDQKVLAQVVKSAELLNALDPAQGLSGAALALRELASGDITSMMERFEGFKRSDLNAIKNLPLEKQMKGLQALLAKVGISNELIEAQADSVYGQWQKASAKVRTSLMQMGTGGLDPIKKKLKELNAFLDSDTFSRWVDVGTSKFSLLVRDVSTGVDRIQKYIKDNKITLSFDSASKVLTDVFNSAEMQKIGVLGAQVGTKIATEAGKSALTAITTSPTLALLFGGYLGLRSGGPLGLTIALSVVAAPWVKKLLDMVEGNTGAAIGEKRVKGITRLNDALAAKPSNSPLYSTTLSAYTPAKKSPLDYVTGAAKDFASNPLWLGSLSGAVDRMVSGSHTGGTGVNRSSSNTTVNSSVTVNVPNMVVREEADIDRIADQLARKIEDGSKASINKGRARIQQQ